jgi:nucleoside-diphosphate-sugar epimerase
MSNIVLIGAGGNVGSRILQNSIHSYIQIDLHNQSDFYKLQKIDIVLHFGEMSSPSLSVEDSLSNLEATLAYYKYARRIGCSTFVYASSHRVFGSWEKSLDTSLHPITNYGRAKSISERLLRDFSEDMATIVLRIGTLLGDDSISNRELEMQYGEWEGKYDYSRSLFSDFIIHLDKLLILEHKGFKVLNVLPLGSILNQIFDGKNFYSNKNL